MAEELEIQATPAGSDPHGKVASGMLTMTARLKGVTTKFEATNVNRPENLGRPESLVGEGREVGTASFDNIHSLLGMRTYCAQMCMADRHSDMEAGQEAGQVHHVLLLRTADKGNNYHPVGAEILDYDKPKKRHGWFDDVPKVEASIIEAILRSRRCWCEERDLEVSCRKRPSRRGIFRHASDSQKPRYLMLSTMHSR